MPKLTDATLAKALKLRVSANGPSQSLVPSFAELRIRAGNSVLADIVSRLDALTHAAMHNPADPELWMQLGVELREQKMPASAKELWKQGALVLPGVPFEDWIRALPTPDMVEPIRKRFATPVADFMARLLSLGDRLYETAGAEWMLQHGKPDAIAPLVDALLDRRPRPRGLADAHKLLAAYLKKDPKGLRLLQVVSRAQAVERRLALLAEIAGPQIVLHAGKLSRELPVATVRLIDLMFAARSGSPKGLRKTAVNLAQLAANILTLEPVPSEVAPCLDSVARMSAEIRVTSAGRNDAGLLWTFEPVAGRGGRQQGITLEGARQWALVYSRARIDGRDLGYLESFASNVGIQEFATSGQTTYFSPNLHDDAAGGLLAGDQVTVISSGWQLDGVTVVKATVRAKAGDT